MKLSIDLSLSGLVLRQGTGASSAFFEDAFDEAEATVLSSHAPEVGTGWSVVKLGGYGGEFTVGAGTGFLKATADANNDGVGGLATVTYSSADYEVSSTLIHAGGIVVGDRAGLVIRYQDANNFYSVVYAIGSGDDMFLIKQLTGNASILDQADTDIDFTTARTVKFRAVGTALSVLVDDVEVLSATDASISSAGQGGLGLGTFMGAASPSVDDSWSFLDFSMTEL